MLELAEPMERGASGSGWFRVGLKVWRGRYKSRVSGCGRVIVCSMAVPPFFECVCRRGFQALLRIRLYIYSTSSP